MAMAASFFLMQYTREELRITYDANSEMPDAGGDSVDERDREAGIHFADIYMKSSQTRL